MRGNIYIEKANYCTLMSQQSRDGESRDNWLWLATQWLSLATTGSIYPFDKPESRNGDAAASLTEAAISTS